MKSFTILSFLTQQLSLAAASTIPAALSKRAAVSNATLLAYGTSTDAWPVAYGLDDGEYTVSCAVSGLKLNDVVLSSKALCHSQPQQLQCKPSALDLGYVSYHGS